MIDHRVIDFMKKFLSRACWRVKVNHAKQGTASRKSPGPASLSPWSQKNGCAGVLEYEGCATTESIAPAIGQPDVHVIS